MYNPLYFSWVTVDLVLFMMPLDHMSQAPACQEEGVLFIRSFKLVFPKCCLPASLILLLMG